MDASGSIWPWIVEFVLLEPIESEWADNVIAVIPPSRLSDALLKPRIKKSLHLRSLAHDLHHRSFTFRTLETLELIEEIDRPAEITDSMCRAYWAVAAECTSQGVGVDEDGAVGRGDLEDPVDRLWKARTGDMNGAAKETSGLLSDILLRWRTCLARLVPDPKAFNQLMRETTKDKTVELLGLYLTEAMQQLGPSFLHLEGEKAVKPGIDGLGTSADARAGVIEAPNDGAEAGLPEAPNDGAEAGLPEASNDGADAGGSGRPLSSDMVVATTSSLGNDPKPVDATTGNQSAAIGWNRKQQERQNETGMPKEGHHNHKDPPGSSNQTCTLKERTGANQNQGKRVLPLMAWNSTARTHQWGEDSEISTPEEDPKERKWSNLKKTVRRVPRKWSVEEEDTLREAVKRFGRGRWKLILNIYQATFEGRTEVDLKDKWRNMTAR